MRYNHFRIGVVACNFTPENIAMAIRMKHLVDALTTDGFRVTVYTSTKSVEPDKDFKRVNNRLPPPSNLDGFIIRFLKEFFFGIETLLRIIISRQDFYIITSPPFFSSLLACFGAWIRSIPYVFDVRDEYPEVFFAERIIDKRGLPGKLLTWFEKLAYNHALIVSTVTTRIVGKIQTKVQRPSKVILFRNGYAAGIEPVEKQNEQGFKVVFHGNMGKFQNPGLIVALAERCAHNGRNIKFEIFGWGNNAQVVNEKKLENLQFFGEVEHSTIASYIPHIKLGISFQRNGEISSNSFPSKVLEFIGAGVPVLITPISEAGEFVEKHGLGFQFDADAIENIYDTLVRIYDDHSLWEQMRLNALNIRKTLSRQYLSDQFVGVIKKHLSHE